MTPTLPQGKPRGAPGSRRRAGIDGHATACVRRRRFEASLGHRQCVDRELSRLAVERELEPVGQEGLQHEPHVRPIGVAFRFGLDIVAFRIDPGRTADNLRGLDRVGVLDEHHQRSVHCGETAARQGANAHAACAYGSVWFDRRHLELGPRGLLAEHSERRDDQQNRHCEDTRSEAGARGRTGVAEQPCDAVGERAAVGGDGSFEGCRTAGFPLGQGLYVGQYVAGDGDGHVVAARFALAAEMSGDPPDRGVVEEQRLGDALQDVDQIIVTPDVREFVHEEGFEVFGRQSAERAHGQRTTGRSQPTTVGTCTRAEIRRRTGRERPMRVASPVSTCCHSGGAGRTSMERMRAATTQPPARRTQNAIAPISQMATTQGRSCAGSTAGRGGTDGKGQGRGGRRGWGNIADAIRGVRNCVGRPQQAPRDERSSHHSCECRAGQQVPGVRARNALHRLACAGVQGSDRRALPEEVDEGPAEAFYPGLGGEDLDCVHRDRPFCFTKVSSIPRISANSSGEAGCADSAPSSRLPAEPLNARFNRSPAICCCVCSLGTPAS